MGLRSFDENGPESMSDLNDVFNKIHNDFLDIVKQEKADGNEVLADRFNDLLQYWDAYKSLVKSELISYNFDIKREQELEEDEKSEKLNFSDKLLRSAKDNATGNTRLMIDMMVDENYQSKYFGQHMVKLAKRGESWAKLHHILSGIVDLVGEESTAQEQMLEAIKKEAKIYPPFNSIIEILENPNVAEFKKTQFYNAFSGQDNFYSMSLYNKMENGEFEIIIGNADSQNKATQLRNEWVETFKLFNVQNNTILNKHQLQAAVDGFTEIYSKIINSQIDTVDSNDYIKLSKMFNKVNINLSPLAIRNYVLSNKVDNRTTTSERNRFLNGLIKMQYIFRNNENTSKSNVEKTSIMDMLSPNFIWDSENNFINNNSILKDLAQFQGLLSKTPGEGQVLGADGRTYQTKVLNHFMSKTLARWRNQTSLLETLGGKIYHSTSKWISDLLIKSEDDVDTRFGDLQIETFLFNKIDNADDTGTTFNELVVADDVIERINRTLYGATRKDKKGSVFSVLTMGDRSTWYQVSGVPMMNFKLKPGELSTTNGKKAVSLFYNYLLGEINRISYVARTEGAIDLYPKNKKTKTSKGLESSWFPDISMGSAFANEIGLYNTDGTHNVASLETTLLQFVAKSLRNQVINEMNNLKRLNIIKEDKLQGIGIGIQNAYNIKSVNEKIASEGLYSLVADYTINSMIANIEFTKLFTGDPQFYDDISKRSTGATASGTDAMYVIDPETGKKDINFTVGVVEEFKFTSPLLEDYVKTFKKELMKSKKLKAAEAEAEARKILQPYTDMKIADGQGWITPQRFRSIMRMMGTWQDSIHQPLYDKLMSKDASVEDMLGLQQLMLDAKFPMGQPIKGQHYELRYDEDNELAIPTNLKYSQSILWPGIVKNTDLEKMLDLMNELGIDEMVPPSAIKAGVGKIMNFNDFITGKSDISTMRSEFKPIVLDNFHYRRQQDLPSKYYKTEKSIVGSQPKKNLLANIVGRVIVHKGEKIEGEDFIQKVHDNEIAISNFGKQQYNQKNGIDENGNISNSRNLLRKIKESFIKEQATSNVVNQLRDAKQPLDAIFQASEKIENALYADLTKSVVTRKSKGGAFIQMSSSGFNKISGFSKLPIGDRNGVIYLKDTNRLRGMRIESGNVVSAEVFLPYKVIESIPNIDQLIKDGLTGELLKEMLGDTVNDIIGYRIPNQGLSSIDSLEIVGILPPTVGDTMIVYDEIVAKTGSDFDIDKMYVLMPHTRWNSELNKMEKVPAIYEETSLKKESNENEETYKTRMNGIIAGLENARIELWNSVLKSDSMFGEVVAPLDSDFLSNDAYYISFLELLRRRYNETKENHDARINKIKAELGIASISEFLKTSNKIEVVNEYMRNKNLTNLEMASPWTQIKIKLQNIAGKIGVGQTANHLTHHALAQKAKLYLKMKLDVGNKTDKGFLDLSQVYNEKGDTITSVLTQWFTAYVDNAKDPYIAMINNNAKTANVVFMLLRAGVDPVWVNRFLTQPIIKDYIENKFNAESKFLETVQENYETIVVNTKGDFVKKEKYGTPDAVSKTFSQYGLDIKTTNTRKKLNLNSLNVDKLEKEIVLPSKSLQESILKEFLRLELFAIKLNDAVRASKSDTQGAYQNSAENLAARSLFEKVKDDGIVGNFMNLFNNTSLGSYKKQATDYAKQVFGKIILNASPTFEATIDSMMYQMGFDNTTDSKLIKKISGQLKSYLYSGAHMLQTNPTDMENMFYGDSTMANKILKAKELLPDSVLLESFGFKLNQPEGPDFVILPSSTQKDSKLVDEMWLEWDNWFDVSRPTSIGHIELYDGYTMLDLAEDLIKYAYSTSGFQKGINTFYELIPHTYMNGSKTPTQTATFNKYLKKVLKEAQNGHILEKGIEQIFRHNVDNDTFVPGIKVPNSLNERNETIPDFQKLKDKGIEKVGNLLKEGFKIKDSKIPTQFGILEEMGELSYWRIKPFVKLSTDKNNYLYKYVGEVNGEHYFEATTPLGININGNRIVEYQVDKEPSSIINEEVKGFPLSLHLSIGVENYDYDDKSYSTIGDVVETENSFTFTNLPDTRFEIREVEVKGNERKYEIVAITDNVEKVVSSNITDKETAIETAIQKLRNMGVKRVQKTLNNMC